MTGDRVDAAINLVMWCIGTMDNEGREHKVDSRVRLLGADQWKAIRKNLLLTWDLLRREDHQPQTKQTHVFELVDNTEGDIYFSLGVWPSWEAIMAALSRYSSPDEVSECPHPDGHAEFIIRRREFGWSETGVDVTVITWQETEKEKGETDYLMPSDFVWNWVAESKLPVYQQKIKGRLALDREMGSGKVRAR